MKLSNPTVYPITGKFEQFLIKEKILYDNGNWSLMPPPNVREIASAFHEYLGEAERSSSASELATMFGELVKEEMQDIGDEEDEQIMRRRMLDAIRQIYQDTILFQGW